MTDTRIRSAILLRENTLSPDALSSYIL